MNKNKIINSILLVLLLISGLIAAYTFLTGRSYEYIQNDIDSTFIELPAT